MAAKKKAAVKKKRRNQPLNIMQQRFCQEYVVDFNATQAAIRAGYSAKTAGAQGHKLLKIAEIQEYITQVSDNLREKTEIDAIWVRQRLAMMATADIRKILDSDGNVLPADKWPDDVASVIAGLDVNTILSRDDDDRESRITKIKRVDPLRALELLGKHKDIAAFKEVVEHNAGESMVEAIMAGRKRARCED